MFLQCVFNNLISFNISDQYVCVRGMRVSMKIKIVILEQTKNKVAMEVKAQESLLLILQYLLYDNLHSLHQDNIYFSKQNQ